MGSRRWFRVLPLSIPKILDVAIWRTFSNSNQYCRVQINTQVEQSDVWLWGFSFLTISFSRSSNTFDKSFLYVFEHIGILVQFFFHFMTSQCEFPCSWDVEPETDTPNVIIYSSQSVTILNFSEKFTIKVHFVVFFTKKHFFENYFIILLLCFYNLQGYSNSKVACFQLWKINDCQL
jgi:hypothetical protein